LPLHNKIYSHKIQLKDNKIQSINRINNKLDNKMTKK
jgi:hypothetical protein